MNGISAASGLSQLALVGGFARIGKGDGQIVANMLDQAIASARAPLSAGTGQIIDRMA